MTRAESSRRDLLRGALPPGLAADRINSSSLAPSGRLLALLLGNRHLLLSEHTILLHDDCIQVTTPPLESVAVLKNKSKPSKSGLLGFLLTARMIMSNRLDTISAAALWYKLYSSKLIMSAKLMR